MSRYAKEEQNLKEGMAALNNLRALIRDGEFAARDKKLGQQIVMDLKAEA